MIQTSVYYQRCLTAVLAGVDEVVIEQRHRVVLLDEAKPPMEPKRPRRAPPRGLTLFQWRRWQVRIVRALVAPVHAPAPPAPPLATDAPPTRWMRPAIRASKKLRRDEMAFKLELDRGPALPPMPESDLQCRAMGLGTDIPCPYVSCEHHLGIEVMRSGALRVIYPHWEDGADDSEPTCVLAEARKGEHTAAEMGRILGIGLNRVGQIEAEAVAKFAARMGMTEEQLRRLLAGDGKRET